MPSIFDLTVPVLLRGFDILDAYVDKAEAFAAAHGLEPAALIEARLAPGMMTFAGQIQRASDNAKNGISRLTGEPAPSIADDERTFADLRARIAKTRLFLKAARPESFADAEDKTIELRFLSASGTMPGRQYVVQFLVPNFFFHLATAHGILRNRGVEVNKKDYLGPLQ